MTLNSAEILEIKRCCIKCGEHKSIDSFSKNKVRGIEGLRSLCKVCHSAHRRADMAASPEKRRRKYRLAVDNKRTPPIEQECCRCGVVKPIGEFYKSKAHWHGHSYACRDCVANKHKTKYRADPVFRKTVIKRATDRNRLSKYGVSPEEFQARLLTQGGGCAICNKKLDESTRGLIGHVDHNHDTGKVRGILCSNCNTGLGVFKENKKSLLKAISYLTFYEEG